MNKFCLKSVSPEKTLLVQPRNSTEICWDPSQHRAGFHMDRRELWPTWRRDKAPDVRVMQPLGLDRHCCISKQYSLGQRRLERWTGGGSTYLKLSTSPTPSQGRSYETSRSSLGVCVWCSLSVCVSMHCMSMCVWQRDRQEGILILKIFLVTLNWNDKGIESMCEIWNCLVVHWLTSHWLLR